MAGLNAISGPSPRTVGIRARGFRAAFAATLVLAALGGGTTARAAPAAGAVTASALTQAPLDHSILLATDLSAPDENGNQIGFAFRSTDGGITWRPVTFAGNLTGKQPADSTGTFTWEAPVAAIDGRHLYLNWRWNSSPDSSFNGVDASDDGGAHWREVAQQPDPSSYDFGRRIIAVSRTRSSEVYGAEAGVVQKSLNYGKTFTDMTQPATAPGITAGDQSDDPLLLSDPVVAGRLYALVYDGSDPAAYAWSNDDGKTWSKVKLPQGVKIGDVAMGTDPHLPGQLVLRSANPRVRGGDRIYATGDGATWTAMPCPGDLAGICPASVVDDAFGAGRSYGLYPDGIHAFAGTGAAGPRLALSSALPLPAAAITAMLAGPCSGAVVYLLGKHTVYRSADGGAHWQRAGVPATQVSPPAHQPGALYVSATHHWVAPQFVAFYQSLGLRASGFPLDEAYKMGGTLYQDFERVELLLARGSAKPAIAPLGTAACATQCPAAALQPAASTANTATSVYFPATKHAVQDPFLPFWQQHNGQTLLGAPISGAFTAPNRDGSGRSYLMQYFPTGRLEYHPEVTDKSYSVQYGLLGRELLACRGWGV